MIKKGGLGRGLGSLISSRDIYDVEVPGLIMCPVDKIRPNPDQPRKAMEQEALKELAESIAKQGLIQPLVVREAGGEEYQLIAGERRWRAARMAGLSAVPVVVKDVSDEKMLELALVENIQRQDLNPLEENLAYRQLAEAGLTQAEIAKRVGKNRATVANMLRLLSLPQDIQEDIAEGRISAGHARAILMLDDTASQRRLRDTIVKLGMSVRQAEGMARRLKEGQGQERAEGVVTDPDMEALCQDLSRIVGSRVRIRVGARGGRLEIRCRSRKELERLIGLLRSLEE
jgi:ParB family chromosome partitioning protein